MLPYAALFTQRERQWPRVSPQTVRPAAMHPHPAFQLPSQCISLVDRHQHSIIWLYLGHSIAKTNVRRQSALCPWLSDHVAHWLAQPHVPVYTAWLHDLAAHSCLFASVFRIQPRCYPPLADRRILYCLSLDLRCVHTPSFFTIFQSLWMRNLYTGRGGPFVNKENIVAVVL